MNNDITIEKLDNGYILKYKGQHLYKSENPTEWEIVKEPAQLYTAEQYAQNEIRSLKRYINNEFNGDYSAWEKSKSHIELSEAVAYSTARTLNQVLIDNNLDGHDICDVDYDVEVFFGLIEEVDDNYDRYIKQLGDELLVMEPYEAGDLRIVVNLAEYVQKHSNQLLRVINVAGDSDEEIEEALVCEVMPALISGYTSDRTYGELLK